MKQKHMFSLLDQTFTTVHVHIHGDRAPAPKPPRDLQRFKNGDLDPDAIRAARWTPPVDPGIRSYTYKVPKVWGIKVGDMLVVPSHDNVALSTVVRVDAEPEIDLDADFTYKWAVHRIDFGYHEELVGNEKRFADSLLEIERVKQRESVMDSFRNSLPEGSAARQLFEQTTAALQAPAAPPVTAAPAAPPVAPAPGSEAPPAAPWEAGA